MTEVMPAINWEITRGQLRISIKPCGFIPTLLKLTITGVMPAIIWEITRGQSRITYNQALRIHPNYANAYNNRGSARYDLGDNKGALEDLQKAADLFQQQKNTESYQKAMDLINKLGLRG